MTLENHSQTRLQLVSTTALQDPTNQQEVCSSPVTMPRAVDPIPPLTGPDTSSYSQIHKAIKQHPYIKAGLDSYEPASVWPLASDIESLPSPSLISFLSSIPCPAEEFPTLAELNDELGLVQSMTPEQNPHISDISNSEVLTNDHQSLNIQHAPAGPLCLVNQPITSPQQLNVSNEEAPAPTFDIQSTLINLIRSDDKILAITYTTPYTSHIEWKLVQVDIDFTLNHHPSALQDGKLFVNFLIGHPSDRQFNAPNQRLWPEYHERQGVGLTLPLQSLLRRSPLLSSVRIDPKRNLD
jgi:hypothetical protein